MNEFVEDKQKKNNFCRSCKRYHREDDIDGTCPTCGCKLSTYRPHKRYFTNEETERKQETGKLININRILDKHREEFRTLTRKIDNLESRYIQMVNLLKIMSEHAGKKKKWKRVTMDDIISYMEKVINEPDEPDIDLVDEIINYKDIG